MRALAVLLLLYAAADAQDYFVPGSRPVMPEGRQATMGEAVVLADAIACPAARDVIYFYRSGTDAADPATISAFAQNHGCAVLQRGTKYRVLGWGGIVSGISVAGASMSVLTAAIVGQ